MEEASDRPAPRLVDAAALRALAHPLRVRLLEQLSVRRQATASMLARDVGETSGATSYHLRQLARHGLIEEDAGRGTAKERWWRPLRGGVTLLGHHFMADSATRAAAMTVVGEIHRGRAERLQHWLDTAGSEWSTDWVEASIDAQAHLRLDHSQLAALVTELQAVVDRYREVEPGHGAAPVEVQINAFPKSEPADRP